VSPLLRWAGLRAITRYPVENSCVSLAGQNTCRALFASRPLLYLIAFPGAVLYLVPETDAVALVFGEGE
jgi:hypothetical protein